MNGDMNGDTGNEDVRRWLGSALSGEPPLSIDRAEILRQGRRGLRNRKLFQAGGAVTGAVVVVVGAVLVSGLLTREPTAPPAAESTPTSSEEASIPPTTVESTPAAPQEQADVAALRLTDVVSNPAVFGEDSLVMSPVAGTNGPRFEKIHPSVYGMQADLRTADTEGWLWVLVEKGPGKGASCEVIQEPVEVCETRLEFGMDMTVAVQRFSTGEVRRVVRSVRPDGCFVTVTSSNLTARDRDRGVPPSKEAVPVLAEQQMIKIAALPDLYVG